MASKASPGLWTLGLVVALVVQCAVAADHVVGGSTGWAIPSSPSFYQTWAKNQTFKVGDKLEFRFQTGNHNVERVTNANYDSCGTGNALETHTAGPTTITLSKSGTYYFLCGVPGHCTAGQKVSLTVGSGKAATPSPSPSPAPSPAGAAPASSVSNPAPSTTPGAPSPGGVATPSGSGPSSAPSESAPSAGSRASLGVLAVFLSVAAFMFH